MSIVPPTTIELRDVAIEFPRKRVHMGPIGKSLLKLVPFYKPPAEEFYTALKDINLTIKEKEIVGLVGRNGAGKSTLLRVMAGIYRPDTGKARTGTDVLLLAGVSVGFNVNLSGRENTYLYGSILGVPRERIDELMDSIIDFSELHEFIDEPLRTYSSGMRSRLGFSIASAVNPSILLIDEVLAVGDAEFKKKSSARIREIVDEAHTVVVASHNMQLLRQVCTRAVLIEKGRIRADGDPSEIIEIYQGKKPAPAQTKLAQVP